MLSFAPARQQTVLAELASASFPTLNLQKLRHYLQEMESFPVQYKGHRYASCAEAACGEMLRRHIPGFEIKLAKTFQIPIDDPASSERLWTIDFGFGQVLIEYHPARFWRSGRRFGDFRGAREYFEYRHTLQRLPISERGRFTELTKLELLSHYEERRRALLAKSEHKGKTLIAVGSPEELYHRVIKVHGTDVPSLHEFVAAFRQIVEELTPQRKKAGRLSARPQYKHDDSRDDDYGVRAA